MATNKIYYQDYFLTTTTATVVGHSENAIVLDQTIAFAEGGGQSADIGVLKNLSDNSEINFVDTIKTDGRTLDLANFPNVDVATTIYHIIDENHIDKITNFPVGTQVEVSIDTKRRADTTRHHSALHLLALIVDYVRPGLEANLIGSSNSANSGRLDFATDTKIQADELAQIKSIFEQLVHDDMACSVYPHPDEPEALYWKTEACQYWDEQASIIPCGGTHTTTTGQIGVAKINRKSIGAGKDRLIVKLQDNPEFIKNYN